MKTQNTTIRKASKIQICFMFLTLFFANLQIIFSQNNPEINSNSVEKVRKFIVDNWPGTIEYNPEDRGDLIGLPKPYNVPSAKGEAMFKELYYWDTYFTNLGVINADFEQAKNNVENILYLVDRYGKMPNGSRIRYLNRSQPPYLSMMVADIYKHSGDKKWLKKAVDILEKEYSFWMNERVTPIGLNHFSSSASIEEKLKMANYVKGRIKKPDLLAGLSKEEKITLGGHFVAEAESGWDFNPRFMSRCEDFIPIDLNSNLYLYEKNFAFFYKELDKGGEISKWESIAKQRKDLINKYCYDEKRNLFFDYDYVNNKKSPIVSSALFSLLYSGVATSFQAEGIVANLPLLETEYGLRCTMEGDYELVYQWGEANGWAPIHFLAVKGLQNYGYQTEADRISKKYINLITKNFEQTNNLWEKYNVLDGSINTSNEYKMPAFLGWTAGVFIYLTNS